MSVSITTSMVSGQSSDNWQTVKDVIQNPDQFSNSRNIGAIIEKLDRNIQNRCWFDEQRNKERRQAIWLLSQVLFWNGWDNSQNRQRVINIVNQWNIDQAIFYEMKDTVEAYKVITSEKDKKDLDKSIEDLIELG